MPRRAIHLLLSLCLVAQASMAAAMPVASPVSHEPMAEAAEAAEPAPCHGARADRSRSQATEAAPECCDADSRCVSACGAPTIGLHQVRFDSAPSVAGPTARRPGDPLRAHTHRLDRPPEHS